MFTKSTEVSNLQPFILEAIKFVKEEILEEIPKDNHGNAECSYENLSTAIKTEVFIEDTGNEQQDKDPCSTVDTNNIFSVSTKNIKQEALEEYDVTYQLVKFWPAGTNISENSQQNQTLQEVIASGKEDNIRTEQGCNVSDSIRLSSGDHYNQSPVNTALKCSTTETNVLWTETENKYSIQESVTSCGKSLSQCGSDAGDTDENNYVCGICSKVFLQETELNEHKLTHNEFQSNDCDTEVCQHKSIDKSYQCGICDKTFSHEYYLEQHTETHISGLKYKCNGCNVTFNTFNKLKDHKYHHCESRKYQCVVCDKLFETSYGVESHYKLVHNIGNNYKCDVCNKECKTKKHLSAHMVIHKEKLKYKCKLCFKNFRKFSALKAHGVVHISREHKCDMCNKAYKTAENLSQHKLTHGHQKNATPNRSLQHISLHRDDTNISSLIDMRDFGKRKLRNQVVHINIRKHKCDICGKAFVRAYDMVRHRLRHGSKKSDLSLACLSLDSDKDKAVTETSNQKVGKYKCNQCKKTFSRGHILSQHMSSFHNHDSDPRKHKCSLCDKAFTRADTLLQHKLLLHRRNNNDIRKYKCNICDKIFLWGNSLRRHKLSVHKNKKKWKQLVLDSTSEMSDNVPHVTFNSDNCDLNEVEFKTDGIQPEHKTHSYIMYGDNKDYECSVCNKTLASSYSLCRHWKAFHSSKRDSTKYKCGICDSAFLWAHGLKRHMLSVHRNKHRSNKASKHISFHKDDSNKAYTSGDSSELKLCHQVLGTGKRKFKCDLCGKGFQRVGHVTRHKLSVHRKEKDAKVKEACNSTSELSDNLPQHVSFGLDNNSYENKKEFPIDRSPAECGIRKCENHVSDKSLGLQKTVEHSIRSSINNNKCNICGKVFTQNSSVKRHKLSVHKNEKRNKQNKVLGGISEPHVSFNRDNKNDKNKGEVSDSNSVIYNEAEYDSMKEHKCNVCGKTFRWPYLMKRHKLSAHRNKKHEVNKVGHSIRNSNNNNKCNICGKVFSQNSSVKRHELSVHKNEKRNKQKEVLSGISEPCVSFNQDNKSDINEGEFAVNNSAIYNEAEYESMKKHKCNVCGKAFMWPYIMKRHKLSAHRNKKHEVNKVGHSIRNSNNNNKCNICGKVFSQNSSVKRHELSVHKNEKHNKQKEVLSGISEPRVSFNHDNKSDINEGEFAVNNSAIYNEAEYESMKKHKCNVCGKAFMWPYIMKRHKLSAHRNKKHEVNKVGHSIRNTNNNNKCNICGKVFTQNSSVMRHKLSVHKNEKNIKQKEVLSDISEPRVSFNHDNKSDINEREFAINNSTIYNEAENDSMKKHKCNVCGKAFRWRHSMKRHKLSVHRKKKHGGNKISQYFSHINADNNKLYICKVADKSPELKLHNQVVSVDSVDRKYKCNFCGKTFTWSSSLYRHKSTVHRNKKYWANKVSQFSSHIITGNEKASVIADKSPELKLRNLVVLVESVDRKYKCNFCSQAFMGSLDLSQHILSVHSNKKHEGNKVSQNSSNIVAGNNKACIVDDKSPELKLHEQVVPMENDDGKYKCNFCGLVFRWSYSLEQHKLSVHRNTQNSSHIDDGNNETCIVADELPELKTDKHITMPVVSVDEMYKCNLCYETFALNYNLIQHKLVTHGITSSIEKKCNICGKTFSKSVYLTAHKFTFHGINNGVKNYKCNICDKTFLWIQSLKRHELLVHKNQRKYKCDLCEKVFTRARHVTEHKLSAHRKKDECYKVQSGLSQHVSFHSLDKTETAIDSVDSVEVGICGKKFEAFTCDICGRKFKKPHNLLQHKVVHMNVKYNCKICNKSFSEPDILLQHMSLHRGSGKNHQCNVCNKVYTSAYHLKRHKVLHNKVKMYKCDMCDRLFAKTFNLLQHKLSDHNVVREYNCDVCDRGFVTAELLSQHVSLHSDDNCHHCDVCNMVYIKHEHLVQHKLTHNHC